MKKSFLTHRGKLCLLALLCCSLLMALTACSPKADTADADNGLHAGTTPVPTAEQSQSETVSDPDVPVSESSTTDTDPVDPTPEGAGDVTQFMHKQPVLAMVYTDPESPAYKKLMKKISAENIKHKNNEPGAVRLIVVPGRYDLTLTLEQGRYDTTLNYFRVFDEFPLVEASKSETPYVIEGVLSEGIPDMRLTVKDESFHGSWLLTYDGKGDRDAVEIVGMPWPPDNPTETALNMVPLCAASAMANVYYEKNKNVSQEDRLWQTVRAAITLAPPDNSKMENGNFAIHEWMLEAYAIALTKPPFMPELPDNKTISYHPERFERYEVKPFTFKGASYEVLGPDDSEVGAWSIGFQTLFNGKENYPIVYMRANPDYNPETPFDYRIIKVVRPSAE